MFPEGDQSFLFPNKFHLFYIQGTLLVWHGMISVFMLQLKKNVKYQSFKK